MTKTCDTTQRVGSALVAASLVRRTASKGWQYRGVLGQLAINASARWGEAFDARPGEAFPPDLRCDPIRTPRAMRSARKTQSPREPAAAAKQGGRGSRAEAAGEAAS